MLDLLDNPKEIWDDEFRNRLQREDRIFLITLYSLTNGLIDSKIHKQAFYSRISMENIDTSLDPWDSSKEHLMDGLIKIIDKRGEETLSVADPSVNDYLDVYIKNNLGEVNNIITSATEYVQVVRVDKNAISEMIKNGSIIKLHFENDYIKRKCILDGIIKYEIFLKEYFDFVKDFMLCPVTGVVGPNYLQLIDIYLTLLKYFLS